MDGITFGAVYFFSSLMPFDLNVLPVEQFEKAGPKSVIGDVHTSWKISKPGEIEMKNDYLGGNSMSTRFKVDAQGRILAQDVLYADSARGHGEYTYTGGNLANMSWSHNGGLTGETRYTWTDGKLATAETIEYSNPDTTMTRFFWVGDRIDSMHIVGNSPYPEGTGYKYTYPTRDSVHMVMHLRSADLDFGFTLQNGRILAQSGVLNSVFQYPASVGVRPRPPLRAGRAIPWFANHDWLGRAKLQPHGR